MFDKTYWTRVVTDKCNFFLSHVLAEKSWGRRNRSKVNRITRLEEGSYSRKWRNYSRILKVISGFKSPITTRRRFRFLKFRATNLSAETGNKNCRTKGEKKKKKKKKERSRFFGRGARLYEHRDYSHPSYCYERAIFSELFTSSGEGNCAAPRLNIMASWTKSDGRELKSALSMKWRVSRLYLSRLFIRSSSSVCSNERHILLRKRVNSRIITSKSKLRANFHVVLFFQFTSSFCWIDWNGGASISFPVVNLIKTRVKKEKTRKNMRDCKNNLFYSSFCVIISKQREIKNMMV